jgi:hexosaminidase
MSNPHPFLKRSLAFFTKLAFLIFFACKIPSMAQDQRLSVIPLPADVQMHAGHFALTAATTIGIPARQAEAASIAAYFADKVKPATGYDLKISTGSTASIRFVLNSKADARLGKEGYVLTADREKIVITANAPAGLFYGVQTLLQLLPAAIESNTPVTNVTWNIPAVTINDQPRFAWRGMMLDVSRHFFSKEYVMEFIDRMAKYKFNRLHWHLTDDNGWRIEIKSLPRLTTVGAWRVPRTGTFGSNTPPRAGEAATYGGFYTQDDIREIVQYARQRYIEILPEIDVPGHSMAALAAYPELSVTKDTSTRVNPGTAFSTWFGDGKFEMHVDNTLNPTDEKVYQFLDKVFGEVSTLFPFQYIHMGGDECYKGFWERDPKVQAFMKKNGLKNGEELQGYFNRRVNKIVTSKNKKMIGWDEILEGGSVPGAAVMSWRGVKGGIEASHQKHTVVMSPAPIYYLDMMQGDPAIEAPVYSTARLKDVYAFDILAPGIDTAYVLGGQANLWTEQIPTEAQVEYMIYPRSFAVAETLWSPKSKKQWESFVTRAEEHFDRFDHAKINYATSLYDPIIKVTKNKQGQLVVELSTEVAGLDLHYTLDNTVPSQYSPSYEQAIVLPEDVDNFRVVSYRDGKVAGRMITIRAEELVKRVK